MSDAYVTGTPAVYQPIISSAAAAYGVPTLLLSALLKQESGFNPDAVSSTGAEGIAQFEPGTAADNGVNPLDPQSAINGAAKLLAQYQQQFGSWGLALAAYNAGPGAVSAAGNSVPNNGQTPNYVQDIANMIGLGAGSGPAAAVAAIDKAMGPMAGNNAGQTVATTAGSITQAEKDVQSWLTRFGWMVLAAALIWIGLLLLVAQGALSKIGGGNGQGDLKGMAVGGDQVEEALA